MGKTKILVVDDEKKVGDIIQKLLVAKHYRVFRAATPEEAIEVITKKHPHLVFLDIRLGNVSGLDLLPKLKELDKKLKIIVLTGLEDEETIRRAKAQGADDFIAKPFDLELLDRIIHHTLSRLSASRKSRKENKTTVPRKPQGHRQTLDRLNIWKKTVREK
jgi:DNA-binding NtrC family response regulator